MVSMGFCLSHMFALLTFTVLVARKSLAVALPPQQLYWNSILPGTPMPEVLNQLVKPDFIDVEEGMPSVSKGHKGQPIDTGAAEDNQLRYRYYDEYKIHVDPNRTIFFLEGDIHPGTTMNLNFKGIGKYSNAAPFLSRKIAESIPFSSTELSEILNLFSLKSGSKEAHMIKQTIQDCEGPSISGEEKMCATSLESMLDYATSKLGKHIQPIHTEADVEKGATGLQKYTIMPGVKKLADDNLIVCHKMANPYAVFYCHALSNTRAYAVPLKGADGTKAQALAVCHADTSEWSPKHLAFQVLKTKPGTFPICHLLPEDHIGWIPNLTPSSHAEV